MNDFPEGMNVKSHVNYSYLIMKYFFNQTHIRGYKNFKIIDVNTNNSVNKIIATCVKMYKCTIIMIDPKTQTTRNSLPLVTPLFKKTITIIWDKNSIQIQIFSM